MPHVGFIGFGEAAYYISKGLAIHSNVKIHSYDINMDHPSFKHQIFERAQDANVTLVSTLQALLQKCSIVFSATSAKYAEAVIIECQEFLHQDHLFIDMNATSAETQEKVADYALKKTNSYVDAAVMGSLPDYYHQVPMFISGSGVQRFESFANKCEMNIEIVDDTAGSASAIKMNRSIFMKGLTSLLIETLSAGYKSNTLQLTLQSIATTLNDIEFEKLSHSLISRTATHAHRRVSEMEEVLDTLHNIEVDSSMSQATKQKLELITNLNVRDTGIEKSNSYLPLIKTLNTRRVPFD